MTRKLNIIIIHGVGWGESKDHFADELKENIARHFERAIYTLNLNDLPDHTEEEALRFAPVYWSPVTQNPQNELIELLGIIAASAVFGRTTIEIQRQMIGLMGDIIAYGDVTIYGAIHAKIEEAVNHLSVASISERDPDGYANLTMVGHSLGSVLASDYIYDHRDRENDWRWRMPDYHLKLKNIFLLGSPMAMYTLRGNPSATRDQLRVSLDRPVQVDPDNGLWLNMYDPQDPIGLPLSPIDSYRQAGVIDCTVKAGNWITGWNAASHVGYWSSRQVAGVIGHKLALDWAALNSPSFARTYYAREVAALRASLGKPRKSA